MRHTFAVASLLLALSAGTASAGMIAAPPLATSQSGYLTVAATTMVVSHSYAHLRDKPTTHSSTVLATLKHGTKVEVIEQVDNGKWTHVKVGDKEGYISTSLLK